MDETCLESFIGHCGCEAQAGRVRTGSEDIAAQARYRVHAFVRADELHAGRCESSFSVLSSVDAAGADFAEPGRDGYQETKEHEVSHGEMRQLRAQFSMALWGWLSRM